MKRHAWKRETNMPSQHRLLVKEQLRAHRYGSGLAFRWAFVASCIDSGHDMAPWETCRQRRRRIADANRAERRLSVKVEPRTGKRLQGGVEVCGDFVAIPPGHPAADPARVG